MAVKSASRRAVKIATKEAFGLFFTAAATLVIFSDSPRLFQYRGVGNTSNRCVILCFISWPFRCIRGARPITQNKKQAYLSIQSVLLNFPKTRPRKDVAEISEVADSKLSADPIAN